MKIMLPEGHSWKETTPFTNSEIVFQCEWCYATFTHDAIDNSQHFEPGDGTCEPPDKQKE